MSNLDVLVIVSVVAAAGVVCAAAAVLVFPELQRVARERAWGFWLRQASVVLFCISVALATLLLVFGCGGCAATGVMVTTRPIFRSGELYRRPGILPEMWPNNLVDLVVRNHTSVPLRIVTRCPDGDMHIFQVPPNQQAHDYVTISMEEKLWDGCWKESVEPIQ